MPAERPSDFTTDNEVRTSEGRKLAARFIEPTVSKLHELFPDLTANHLTLIGTGGIILGSWLASRKPEHAKSKRALLLDLGLVTLFSVSYAMDIFDGSLARLIALEDPSKANFDFGQIFDVVNDRIQEIISAYFRAKVAHQRGNKIGEYAALGAAATAPLASLARAIMEAKGKKPHETGKNLFETAGSRIGRIASGTAATLLQGENFPIIQPVLDGISTGANLINTFGRIVDAFTLPEDPTISDKTRRQGKDRLKVLAVLTAGTFAGTYLTYQYLEHEEEIGKRIKKFFRPPKEIVIGEIFRDSSEKGFRLQPNL